MSRTEIMIINVIEGSYSCELKGYTMEEAEEDCRYLIMELELEGEEVPEDLTPETIYKIVTQFAE